MNDKLIRPLNREIAAALAERTDFSISGRRVALAMTKEFQMDRYDVLEALTNSSK